MRRMVVMGILVALLAAGMLPAAALTADPPKANIEEWIKSAEQVDTEAYGGVVIKAIKISDQVSQKPLDLLDQYMGSDPYTPKSSFYPGDSCYMVLHISTAQAGTVSLMFLWFGDRFKIWRHKDTGIWWKWNAPAPGEYLLWLDLEGCPDWPGNYSFMAGIKAAWGRDWGFRNPSPYPFTIAP